MAFPASQGMWQHMLVILALRRLGEEDQEFKTSFSYVRFLLKKKKNMWMWSFCFSRAYDIITLGQGGRC